MKKRRLPGRPLTTKETILPALLALSRENLLLKFPSQIHRLSILLFPALFFLLLLVPLSAHGHPKTNPSAGKPEKKRPSSTATNRKTKRTPAPEKSTGRKAVVKSVSAPPKPKYLPGEDPEFAAKYGWPVKGPQLLAGSILPNKRIIAYYGNPLSKRMGVLGEYSKDDMLRRLKNEVSAWQKADPSHPIQPALHLIAVVAQDKPGKAGKYRMQMPDKMIQEVHGWAKEANAILIIDIQTGTDDIRTLLPRFEWILKNADVHLAIDPEFNLIASGKRPGVKVGTYDAADINYAAGFLQNLVKANNLPPKVFVVHRFTRGMVTNADRIELRPEVQIVMNMDGWGAQYLKRHTYRDFIIKEPVQFTGFKLFYHNDTKDGHLLFKPAELLRLIPCPIYIQYQ
jgi:hypothetical protein